MSPDHLHEIWKFARQGFQPTVADTMAMLARITELEDALRPFATVLIGEHRHDEDNVWHSLKVWHFRNARRRLKSQPQQED